MALKTGQRTIYHISILDPQSYYKQLRNIIHL